MRPFFSDLSLGKKSRNPKGGAIQPLRLEPEQPVLEAN